MSLRPHSSRVTIAFFRVQREKIFVNLVTGEKSMDRPSSDRATKSDAGSLASSRMEDVATPAVSFSATANISEVAVGASAGE